MGFSSLEMILEGRSTLICEVVKLKSSGRFVNLNSSNSNKEIMSSDGLYSKAITLFSKLFVIPITSRISFSVEYISTTSSPINDE